MNAMSKALTAIVAVIVLLCCTHAGLGQGSKGEPKKYTLPRSKIPISPEPAADRNS